VSPKALNDVEISTKNFGREIAYAENVYEWEREGAGSCTAGQSAGCVYLISDGRDTAEAGGGGASAVKLIGADATGNNVFFTTADRLQPQDTDTEVDIYDARVCEPENGNPCIQEPPPPLPPCLGEQCHGIPAATPSLLAPGTATFNGEGNLTPAAPAVVKPTPKTLTRAQKLTAALKACGKDRRAKNTRRVRRPHGRSTAPRRRSRHGDARPRLDILG
jgi:hypothetical protein